jgi:hypothetical protein
MRVIAATAPIKAKATSSTALRKIIPSRFLSRSKGAPKSMATREQPKLDVADQRLPQRFRRAQITWRKVRSGSARRISLGHPRHLQRPRWKRFRAAPAAKKSLEKACWDCQERPSIPCVLYPEFPGHLPGFSPSAQHDCKPRQHG